MELIGEKFLCAYAKSCIGGIRQFHINTECTIKIEVDRRAYSVALIGFGSFLVIQFEIKSAFSCQFHDIFGSQVQFIILVYCSS